MIAIYARQSIDKKDSISIESQIEFCKRELSPDEEYTVYQDKGYSGKNTDRPDFQKLLADIEKGKITKIIVYRLDRISRSITDFANIMEQLSKYNVAFVSTTEKFDTSTPMGRAMLYIIMVFAQLERETIAERVKDNYYSRGKTGVWLGGTPPFGYEIAKTTMDGKRVTTIKETPEIEIIKGVFDKYANTSATLGAIAKELKQTYGDKYGIWNNIKLSRLLHNPCYVQATPDIYEFYANKKCILVNDISEYVNNKGLIVFGKRDHEKNKWTALTEHVIVLSLHDGAVDADTFLKCQYKLDQNKQIKNTGKGKYSWLTGLIKCGYCGYSLQAKYTEWKGVRKRYFRCSGIQNNECTHGKTISIENVQSFVENELKNFIANFDQVKFDNQTTLITEEVNRIKIEIFKINEQINNLIDSLASSSSVTAEYINTRITELDMKKSELQKSLQDKTISKRNIILPDMDNWDSSSIEEKHNIAEMFINKVLVTDEEIEIQWKV